MAAIIFGLIQQYSNQRILGEGDLFPFTENPSEDDLFNIHSKWLTFIWTFCDIPILIGRYGRRWKYSYKVHSISMSIVLILHILIVTLNMVNSQLSTGHGNISVRYVEHWRGIITMLICSFALAFTGTILESYYKANNSKISLQKPLLRKFHLVFGIVMWTAAKYTIHTEIQWLGEDWLDFCYRYGRWVTGLLVIAFEAYRLFMNKRSISRTKIARKLLTQEQRVIVEKLQSGITTDQMKAEYPDKYILLFKHLIYDLTGVTHPGGDIIFVNHNFKEISRYVMGTHPDEHENFPTFIHSQSAYNLLDQHLIGSMIDGNPNRKNKTNNNMLLTMDESRMQ
jgi:hypothetical protein